MGNTLKGVIFKKPNRELQKEISLLLDKRTYVRPKDIVQAAISLLKLEPYLKEQLQLVCGNKLRQNLIFYIKVEDFPYCEINAGVSNT